MSDLIIKVLPQINGEEIGSAIILQWSAKSLRKGDGLAENVSLLRAIIYYHFKNRILLNIVFLDVAKVFDSVFADQKWTKM